MKTYLKLILAVLLIFGAMSADAQNIKHGIVKYKNGDIYEGYYIRIPYYKSSIYANRTKIPYGDGGKYTYADGSIFEGTFTDGLPARGTMTYAVEGRIIMLGDSWICPAGCQFIGYFSDGVPYTGEFTNPIISKNNSKYIGRIEKRELSNGTIEYRNGDTFIGSFKNGTPFTGKYTYAQQTVIKDWSIPAGCIFDGDFTTYTGCVDREITNIIGDKYIGNLKDGDPDNGTMTYAQPASIEGGDFFWSIPAGCVFNGDFTTCTGRVDKEITDKDGTKYIGALKDGKPTGEGTMIYSNGNKYVGNLENGKPAGKGTMIYANGKKYVGNLKNGKPNGKGTMIYANSKKKSGEWVDGMSPTAYKAFLAKERREQLAYDNKCLKQFEDYVIKKREKARWNSVDIYVNRLSNELRHGAYLKIRRLFQGKSIINDYNDVLIADIIENYDKIYLNGYTIDQIRYIAETASINAPEPTIPQYLYHKYYRIETIKSEGQLGHRYYWWEIPGSDKISEQLVRRTESYAFNYWIQKFGQYYGTAVYNKEVMLGMTIEMVQIIKGNGNVTKRVSNDREIVILSYGLFGLGSSYTFVNGKLTEYTIY